MLVTTTAGTRAADAPATRALLNADEVHDLAHRAAMRLCWRWPSLTYAATTATVHADLLRLLARP